MRVLLYGIGQNFTRNIGRLRNEYDICGLIDGSPSKQGMHIDEWVIVSPDSIRDIEYDKILVMPNSHAVITSVLMELGIPTADILYFSDIQSSDDVGKRLKAAVRIVGGMGDALIAFNYIKCFLDRFDRSYMDLDIKLSPNRDAVKVLVKDAFPERIRIETTDEDNDRPRDYQLFIRIQRYPEIIHADMRKISRLIPELIDYIQLCEKFAIFNPRFFSRDYVADGDSAYLEVLHGGKRINQPDIYGALGVSEDLSIPLTIDDNVLKRYGLNRKNYITVHRGAEDRGHTGISTKLWMPERYASLIDMIKDTYPEFHVVIVGSEYEKMELTPDDDILDLAGATDLTELAALLKYSVVHIDGEGGLVHLRHAVNGGSSVVLFGPTMPDFFGYSENINLRTRECPYPCEWASEDWQGKCLRGEDIPYCMSSITPEMVMDAVAEIIKRGKSRE